MVHVGPDHQVATIDERGKHGLCDRRNDLRHRCRETRIDVRLDTQRVSGFSAAHPVQFQRNRNGGNLPTGELHRDRPQWSGACRPQVRFSNPAHPRTRGSQITFPISASG